MKKATLLTNAFFALAVLFTGVVQAQEDPPSRAEVGVQFSSITYPATIYGAPGRTEPGFGGRITLNLNKNIALEAEQNFFPHYEGFGSSLGGTLWQGHFGLKVGKRFSKFGVFTKARPGFASFSQADAVIDHITTEFNGRTVSFPIFGSKRQTHFAADLGMVFEFYPSRRVLTRIDVGDTIIHYGQFYDGASLPGGAHPDTHARNTHNVQISAGVGFRFGSLPPKELTSQTQNEKPKRFEVGAQFSSLGLQTIEHFPAVFQEPEYGYITTLAGFGGRFTYNLTPDFALETQADFYQQDNYTFNNQRAGGRTLQVQAGIKAGKRFEKFGVFAKARPGVVSFSRAIGLDGTDPTFGFPAYDYARKTHFSLDVGGVLEFYPSRRIVTRFDGGDTMIFYRSFDLPNFLFPILNFTAPAEVMHNFQFSAGFGFRF